MNLFEPVFVRNRMKYTSCSQLWQYRFIYLFHFFKFIYFKKLISFILFIYFFFFSGHYMCIIIVHAAEEFCDWRGYKKEDKENKPRQRSEMLIV